MVGRAFNLIQNSSDTGHGALVYFLFDLLFVLIRDVPLRIKRRGVEMRLVIEGRSATRAHKRQR
jgi:hypothetical protein